MNDLSQYLPYLIAALTGGGVSVLVSLLFRRRPRALPEDVRPQLPPNPDGKPTVVITRAKKLGQRVK